MKTIIAGSRTCNDYFLVESAILLSGFEITEVVSGCARGVDSLGETWAWYTCTPLTKMPAAWERYGKRAGINRNLMMANYADALIAVWNGESRGTEHMIWTAREKGLEVFVHRYEET